MASHTPGIVKYQGICDSLDAAWALWWWLFTQARKMEKTDD